MFTKLRGYRIKHDIQHDERPKPGSEQESSEDVVSGKKRGAKDSTGSKEVKRPKRAKVEQLNECESFQAKGKPDNFIKRKLQWWCDTCMKKPSLKRRFICCHKKSCKNTAEFSLQEWSYASWRCDDCNDTRSSNRRLQYSRKKNMGSNREDDSDHARDGRRRKKLRLEPKTCKCGQEITAENMANSGSRSVCRICEILDNHAATAINVTSLCDSHRTTGSCAAGSTCTARHLASEQKRSLLKNSLRTLCEMTWSSREDVIKRVRNYFSELQEPDLMQKNSNMQKELRFFCSCYRRKDEISSDKRHYNHIYLEASSATPQKRSACST
jgi:hypothetical protein